MHSNSAGIGCQPVSHVACPRSPATVSTTSSGSITADSTCSPSSVPSDKSIAPLGANEVVLALSSLDGSVSGVSGSEAGSAVVTALGVEVGVATVVVLDVVTTVLAAVDADEDDVVAWSSSPQPTRRALVSSAVTRTFAMPPIGAYCPLVAHGATTTVSAEHRLAHHGRSVFRPRRESSPQRSHHLCELSLQIERPARTSCCTRDSAAAVCPPLRCWRSARHARTTCSRRLRSIRIRGRRCSRAHSARWSLTGAPSFCRWL